MTHAPDMHLRWRTVAHRVLGLATLITLLSACGINSATTTTVDDAVRLLQDIDDSGTWVVLSDALDALDDQDGYLATVTIQSGTLDADGGTTAPSEHTTAIDIHTDADGNARYSVQEGEQSDRYLVIPARSATDSAPAVFRESASDRMCADSAVASMLQEGPLSILNSAALDAAGMRTLSVVEEDGESTILEREATHYMLESRLDDALAILDSTGSDTLREQVEQAGAFALTGTLDIDDDTGALLAFESTYSATDTGQWTNIRFEVTQWADAPSIELPAGDALPECP